MKDSDKRLLPVRLGDPKLLRTFSYVNGAWVSARSGATMEVRNPADGAIIAHVAAMGADEARQAAE